VRWRPRKNCPYPALDDKRLTTLYQHLRDISLAK